MPTASPLALSMIAWVSGSSTARRASAHARYSSASRTARAADRSTSARHPRHRRRKACAACRSGSSGSTVQKRPVIGVRGGRGRGVQPGTGKPDRLAEFVDVPVPSRPFQSPRRPLVSARRKLSRIGRRTRRFAKAGRRCCSSTTAGFGRSTSFPMALAGTLLMPATPARPGACGLGVRRPGPDQMPEQASHFRHGERQQIGLEIERAFFPRRRRSGLRRDRHAPASPA